MQIIFKQLKVKNLLQIGNTFEIFDLNKHDFTAIIGQNGAGKSTIIDSLSYALFKKSFRNIKLGQLINNVNKKNMLVELTFDIGNDEYLVRRGDKPKIFEIYKNDKLIEVDASVTDYQTYLEESIIKQNYKTFCQINIISKAKYVQFMNLDPKSRREIVEDLLDSNIYSVMASLAKEDVKEKKESIKENEYNIGLISNKIENTEKILNTFETQKNEQIASLQTRIDEGKKRYKILLDSNKKIDGEIIEYKKELESIIPAKINIKFNEKIRNLENQKFLHNNDLVKIQKEISNIQYLKVCPTCHQDVDENHKEHIVSGYKADIAEINTKILDIGSQLSKMKEIEERYNHVYEKYNKKIEELTSSNEFEMIKKQILEYNNQIKILREKTLPDLDDVSLLKESLLSFNKERDNLIKEIEVYAKAIKYLGDDGIKAAIINKYIPIFNSQINSYLERLGMFVEFTLDSEFNENITAINRDLFTYSSFSEGQKQRIDLAILLTWREIAKLRNSMSTNLLILDEIMDSSLDQEGTTEFINILKGNEKQNVFIVSHKNETIDIFDNIIKVSTVGNFSKYEME